MTIKMPEAVGYLAWRDGKPCWDGDDCVCEDAVYPVDSDDARESKAIYTADALRDVLEQVGTLLVKTREHSRLDILQQIQELKDSIK